MENLNQLLVIKKNLVNTSNGNPFPQRYQTIHFGGTCENHFPRRKPKSSKAAIVLSMPCYPIVEQQSLHGLLLGLL